MGSNGAPTRTGSTVGDLDQRSAIHDVVVSFYREVVFDDLLAPVFGEVAETDWPLADPALTVDDTVTVAVQVNGKLRTTLQLPRDMDKGAAEQAALADPAVQKALDGKPVKKVIVVPNRIINVVA